MSQRRFKHWGWGYADQAPDPETLRQAAAGLRQQVGLGGKPEQPVPFEALDVPRSKLRVPDSLGEVLTSDPYERTVRSMGKAYRDLVRGFRGDIPRPPDLVALPRDREDVARTLDWAGDQGAAVVPFGGGTSVVGGVEYRPLGGEVERPVVCLDTRRMAKVLEVDETSLAARIEAGASGPVLEDQLREHDLTMRFFLQSFEFATLGGWIATRAAGHFATGAVHIEDYLESVSAVTPTGLWESRRLPGSGAGVSPDRMLAGSEGILGVITDAWVRVRRKPRFRASATFGFANFMAGAEALRLLGQSGLPLANCRLVDGVEALMTGAGDGSCALLFVGFESSSIPVSDWLSQAKGIASTSGGTELGHERGEGPSSQEGWRSAFLMAPYLRDTLVACGVITETFESAITWDRFAEFYATVMEAARTSVAQVAPPTDAGDDPRITCRITHLYPDGPAPYFTVLAPAARGSEVRQWDEIKSAVSEAILGAGGTITHHHAVGRDHRPYYERQRPEPFAEALRAAKRGIDPQGTLNPGVLVDP